ncbi:MAG: hypothetical protein QF719_10115 [Chloroflexota bacterium]|nr:hypothetical protein [Chloroflexota bacterium]MDP6509021.1 hypothetical protein [Chloroflexota bacterium]MDP6758536.1 hypothetical protein [Chloroflexota bacterium]
MLGHLLLGSIHYLLTTVGIVKRRKPEQPDLTEYDEEMDALERLVDSKSSDGDPADEPGD